MDANIHICFRCFFNDDKTEALITWSEQLRRVNSTIRHYLSVQATETLVSAFVLSRLDYCNSLLSGCLQYLVNKLQKVQNNASCLILKAAKTDYNSPHLCSLHWHPIYARIKYKIASLCFSAITSTGPGYLSHLPNNYPPSRQLRSSSDNSKLCIPPVNRKSYGERSFSFFALTLWNTLPKNIIFVSVSLKRT